jgi:hypothetical protein
MQQLNDLEMTKLCAEAMGYTLHVMSSDRGLRLTKGDERLVIGEGLTILRKYDPLHDDAQCMALDQVMIDNGYCITYESDEYEIYPNDAEKRQPTYFKNVDMTKPENRRRMRVECVAKMQEGKP